MKTSVICLDCGRGIEDEGLPKEVAKKHNFQYVMKGKWRCPDCQAFQDNIKEQFDVEAENILVPGRH